MINKNDIANSLKEKHSDFESFSNLQSEDLVAYIGALEQLSLKSVSSIEELIDDLPVALPSAEIEEATRFAFAFKERWENHQEARNWAAEILHKRAVAAVDGSMFYAEKEVTLPVGLLRIGWYINRHQLGERYEKDSILRILTPKFLFEDQDEPLRPETRVGEEMFLAEIGKARELIDKLRGWRNRNEKLPLLFLDRPLLLPFSPTQPKIQKRFIDEIAQLIRYSEDREVPIVGYLDRGFSRDLLNLLALVSPLTVPQKPTLYDSALMVSNFPDAQILRNWGDRTPFCYALRKGFEAYVREDSGKSMVGFVFLKSESVGAARIDLPSWIYENDLIDDVIDSIRAECIVGVGYPYSIETADQVATISRRDRDVFLSVLQEFALEHKLKFKVSRKNASKGRRR